MLRILLLLCFFQAFITVKSGSHSLWFLHTFILGETPFPEFSVVVMLDDIQIGYYDSNVGKIIYRQYRSEHVQEEQEYASNVFGGVYHDMKSLALLSSQKYNSTHGIHVQQRLFGCELLESGIAGPLQSWDAFNGVNDGGLQYSTEQKTFQVEDVGSAFWSYYGRNQIEWMFANIFKPICIKTLKNYLHTKKKIIVLIDNYFNYCDNLSFSVKPRVRLLQQALKDSRGAKVTCLATGFYPRHINLTLLRDGQPVPDHQITGGELLPNADETYQMRKSLEVSAEELQQHHYTCTAEHLSLDNKLDINLDLGPGVGAVPVVTPVVVLGIALLCVFGVIFKCCRKHGTKDYVLAQRSHSLWALSTFIVGDTPFPEFSAVGMLDDIQLVKPRVRLLQQALKAAGGAKVTCLATGFYPRHINLTLLRDSQPVPDHQITGGELLPNADETYQMRKSLEVSAEELQHHHYTCTAEHLSLDNKLDFGLGKYFYSNRYNQSQLILIFSALDDNLMDCNSTTTGP
ncbi:hypothetical protein ACEWY4_011968 [Coilia grayii]|uniref:Ig-like domain-containing protein n=1 Tax=Coilia grayii TaxID=363190 RepID=A0ABD1JZ69_9TELE